MGPDPTALLKLIQRARKALPGLQERAIQSGDFSEVERASKALGRLSDAAEQKINETPTGPPAVLDETPSYFPTSTPPMMGPELPPHFHAGSAGGLPETVLPPQAGNEPPSPTDVFMENLRPKSASNDVVDFLNRMIGREPSKPIPVNPNAPSPPIQSAAPSPTIYPAEERQPAPIFPATPSVTTPAIDTVLLQESPAGMPPPSVYTPEELANQKMPTEERVAQIQRDLQAKADVDRTKPSYLPESRELLGMPPEETPSVLDLTQKPSPDQTEQVAKAATKARETIGDNPTAVIQSVAPYVKDPYEQEFLSRVQNELGKRPETTSLERVLLAILYGAGSLFSRWATGKWKAPLILPDLTEDQRRYDESRRRIASEIARDKSMMTRMGVQNEAAKSRLQMGIDARQKLAETQSKGKTARDKAKDAITELNQNLDAIGKINRGLEQEYSAKVGATKARIDAADAKLKSYLVPGPLGQMVPNDDRLKAEGTDIGKVYDAHDAVVTPLYGELESLKRELADQLKATRKPILGK